MYRYKSSNTEYNGNTQPSDSQDSLVSYESNIAVTGGSQEHDTSIQAEIINTDTLVNNIDDTESKCYLIQYNKITSAANIQTALTFNVSGLFPNIHIKVEDGASVKLQKTVGNTEKITFGNLEVGKKSQITVSPNIRFKDYDVEDDAIVKMLEDNGETTTIPYDELQIALLGNPLEDWSQPHQPDWDYY